MRLLMIELHWRGFEPLTARFVAGYSIQLSYQCTKIGDEYKGEERFLQAAWRESKR